MLSGAYSHRYKAVEKQQVDSLKHVHHEEQADQLARNKRLQQDTNRRRRALAVKRKLEAQREEKRRKEILARRRSEINQATERYQRLNRQYKSQLDGAGDRRSAVLETVERVIQHFAAEEDYYGVYPGITQAPPALDDALRAVRGGSAGYRPGSGRAQSRISASSASGRPHSHTSTTDSSAKKPQESTQHVSAQYTYQPTPPHGERSAEASIRAQLHNNSLRNLTNSRSLFEQQLEHTQQQLKQQQRATLQQFNQAIWRQLSEHDSEAPNDLQRSDSATSLDSLEDGKSGSLIAGSDSNLLRISQHGQINGSHSDSDLLASLNGFPENSTPQSNNHQNGKPLENKLQNGHSQNGHGSHAASQITPHYQSTLQRHMALQNSASTQQNIPYTSVQPNLTQQSFYVGGQFPGASGSITGPEAGFVLHHSNSPSNVAVVQPQVLQRPPPAQPPMFETKPPPNGYIEYNHKTNSPMELLLEEAQETVTDAVDSPVPHTMALPFNHSAPASQAVYHSSQSHPTVNYTTTLGTPFLPKSAGPTSDQVSDAYCHQIVDTQPHHKAWASPSPAVPHSPAPHPPPNTHASHKSLYGTRATSTSATVTTQYSAPPVKVAEKPAEQRYDGMYHQHQYNCTSKAPVRQTSERYAEDSLDEEEEEEEVEEEVKEKEKKGVKGILKKPEVSTKDFNPAAMRRLGLGIRPSFASTCTGKMGTIQTNPAVTLRDSIEVTRDQISSRNENHPKPTRKKCVRFADLTYDDEDIPPEPTPAAEKQPPPPPTEEEPKLVKPTRPSSAKLAPPANRSNVPARVMSAGSYRGRNRNQPQTTRTVAKDARPTTPQSKPSEVPASAEAKTVCSKPPTGNAANSRIPVSAPGKTAVMSAGTITTQVQHAQAAAKARTEPVFDANGIRLDRTPTDEEINWLWEKVRTCLSRNSLASSQQSDQPTERSNNNRQQAPMSQKFIDGSSLAPECRNTTRVNSGMTKKMSMNNINNFNRRMGNPSQQAVVTPTSTSGQPVSSGGFLSGYSANMNERLPYQATLANGNYVIDNNVSESMAGFLVAENLIQKSTTESQIERAMERAELKQHDYNANRIAPKTASALSIEEQRLLQSLERLNERLKMTETNLPQNTAFIPRPPPQRPAQGSTAVQGRIPVRRYSANAAGTVSRHNYRTGSAGTVRVGSAGTVHPSYRGPPNIY